MHAGLMFALDEPMLFTGFAAFNLYTLVGIATPFRRHERCAWCATWILLIGLAAPAFTSRNIARFYSAVAGACVLELLLTMRDFFAADRELHSACR
jgi:hypothetical protein